MSGKPRPVAFIIIAVVAIPRAEGMYNTCGSERQVALRSATSATISVLYSPGGSLRIARTRRSPPVVKRRFENVEIGDEGVVLRRPPSKSPAALVSEEQTVSPSDLLGAVSRVSRNFPELAPAAA